MGVDYAKERYSYQIVHDQGHRYCLVLIYIPTQVFLLNLYHHLSMSRMSLIDELLHTIKL